MVSHSLLGSGIRFRSMEFQSLLWGVHRPFFSVLRHLEGIRCCSLFLGHLQKDSLTHEIIQPVRPREMDPSFIFNDCVVYGSPQGFSCFFPLGFLEFFLAVREGLRTGDAHGQQMYLLYLSVLSHFILSVKPFETTVVVILGYTK